MFKITGASRATLTSNELSRLKSWQISTFWVCLLGYIGYYICRANLPAAFPLMSEIFKYSNSQLGQIAAISEFAYAIGKFINGPLADRFGGRKIFVLGLVGAVVFNILFALSSTIAMFTLMWCACRFFLSMGWGGLAKMIGNWYPPERNGTVMGLISLNFQFGGVVATLFAGYLVSLGVGWQGVFFYPAAVGAVVALWSYSASRERPSDVVAGVESVSITGLKKPILSFELNGTKSDIKVILKGLFKLPLFHQLLVFSFITTLLRSFFFIWTPKILVDMGMGTSGAIFKSALFPFFGCLGTILLGWYTDRYVKNGDRARAMWIMLVGLTATMLLLAKEIQSENSNPIWIGVLLSLGGFFLLGPYSMSSGALTLDIAGSKGAGTTTGLIDGLGYFGGAMASWAAGYFSDMFGWSQVVLGLAVFSLLATLSAYIMSRGFQKIAAQRQELK
jgi:sugar phosphate permease